MQGGIANSRLRSPSQILARRESVLSPWVTLVEKDVRRHEQPQPELYHFFGLADYAAAVALLSDGTIPIVRQFRPAVESFTWELPSGMVDSGEDPEETCRRELVEETGIITQSIQPLGSHFTDTGRLENRTFTYLVHAQAAPPGFRPESGMEVKYVTWPALQEMISRGEFQLQVHLGCLFLVLNFYLKAGERPFQPRAF